MSFRVSTSRLSYWVTTRPGIVARSRGAMSMRGAAVTSIPPVWIDRWRGKPSIRAHISSQRSHGLIPTVEPPRGRARGSSGTAAPAAPSRTGRRPRPRTRRDGPGGPGGPARDPRRPSRRAPGSRGPPNRPRQPSRPPRPHPPEPPPPGARRPRPGCRPGRPCRPRARRRGSPAGSRRRPTARARRVRRGPRPARAPAPRATRWGPTARAAPRRAAGRPGRGPGGRPTGAPSARGAPIPSGRAKRYAKPPSASRSRRIIRESNVSTAFATRSTSGRGNPSAYPTSRIADRARYVTTLQTIPVCSGPYFA